MSKLTDIKQKILQLDGGAFQELCDAYLCKLGYENVLSLGMKSGTMKTTKGIPDTYFLDTRGKYIFVMYTTQQENIYKKIYEDLCDCLDLEKTGVTVSDISEIIYCHTSANLSAGKNKQLHDFCSSSGVLLRMFGVDEISNNIYTRFHILSRDFLKISLSTDQIFEIKDFITVYDSNGMAAPLSTTFQFREKEIVEVINKIDINSVTLITGPAGVGKTRLALECCQKYALENNYRLFCIQSNRLPIYEDLKVYLDNPNKYLLLIDDANQISGLHHILQYLTKYDRGYEVKIVITVRDYARQTTLQDIRSFAIPEVCTISTFSDEEIKKLLETNLQILNSTFLDKIVRIAEGNARLAIIAGKLAVETQSLASINDATQLYEGYYEKYIKSNVFDQDRDLCAVAGIITFLTALNLEHLDSLTPILQQFNISSDLFLKCAYRLHELELVDIYNDKAVKISDQCLGNYLLSYVFIKKRVIPLSVMLKACFASHKPRVINAVNTLANIFASEEMHQQLEKEICVVWDEFNSSRSLQFFNFVKVFHSIRPTETLLMLKEKIDTIPQGRLDFNSIDFEKESRNHSVNDDVLSILGGFHDRIELPVALDLLFEYFKRVPHEFMNFYNVIINSLGVKKDSYRYDYWSQNQLFTKFIEHADGWRNTDVGILFIKVSAEFLKLLFSPTEAGRGNTFIMYQIPVQFSHGSKKYREMIWNGLYQLYENQEVFRPEIENVIKSYRYCSGHKAEKELVQLDCRCITRFFSDLLSPLMLSHCIIAKTVADHFKRSGIDAHAYLSDFLNNADFLVYKTLKGERHLEGYDWRKEQELKEADIRMLLTDCKKETILNIVRICADYQRYDPKNTWDISSGLQYVFNQLTDNEELFLYAVEIYLAHNTPINIFPDPIVNKLFELIGADRTCQLIDKFEYSQKNAWQFSFYKNLPLEFISEQSVRHLYDYLSAKEGDLNSSPFRDILFLEKYRKVDDEVFVRAGKIISEKYDYSQFIFSLYFQSMFSSHGLNIDPGILIDWFKSDVGLLKEIYFKLLSYDRNIDDDGRVLIYFIQHDFSFIDDFIKFTLKNKDFIKHDDESILSVIWSQDNFIELADHIFVVYSHNEELQFWPIPRYITALLIIGDKDNFENIIKHQDEWITHFIDIHFNNSDLMKTLFSAIADANFLPERRKNHLLYLITLNNDYELFENIQLESRSYGGWESESISFLESLLPALTGLAYLKHKRRIEKDIEGWKRQIEHEQIRDILRGD